MERVALLSLSRRWISSILVMLFWVLLLDAVLSPAVLSAGDCVVGPIEQLNDPPIIVDGPRLRAGLDFGLATDRGERDWLSCLRDDCEDDCCRMSMPSGQAFGAVFVVPGVCCPADGQPRRSVDLSRFTCLELELRRVLGVGEVQVGMKDACDPDNGRETKQPIMIDDPAQGCTTTDGFKRFSVPLSSLETLDASRTFVIVEFVFDVNVIEAEPPQTVDFRNVRFTTGSCEVSCEASCAGDCDSSEDVTVDEVITLVNLALGEGAVGDCAAGDTDVSGQITVDEIVSAVTNALNGCP